MILISYADAVFLVICFFLDHLGVIEIEWWVPKWLQRGVQDLPDGRANDVS